MKEEDLDIEDDIICWSLDDYSYMVLDMRKYDNFNCLVFDMWRRYPEFENMETDEFWEEGEEYWYSLPGLDSDYTAFRFNLEEI